MKTSNEGLELIKGFEGLRLEPYRCPAGVWTIGYGHTHNVKPTDLITEIKANVYLREDVEKAEKVIADAVKVELSQSQFDALVDFIFNLGGRNFKKSTLLKKINQRKGDTDVCREFRKWVHSGGAVLEGLVRRREAECRLWMRK